MKVAFCGDFVLRTPKTHFISERLQSLLDTCDVKLINFEVPIETEKGTRLKKSGPNHSQSAASPAWLEEKGFNLITLANNHSVDYGVEALKETVNSFKTAKITGVGTYDSAYNLTVIEGRDQIIGFLGLTHKEFGCVDVDSKNEFGTAMATSPKALSAIVGAKTEVDQLYVIVHAGVEYMDAPLPEWRELYHSYIDLGANGVIASHPHIPQGWEIYQGCPICYSLGNFLFEGPKPEKRHPKWFSSLMVVINTADNTFDVISLIYDYKKNTVDIDTSLDAINHNKYLNSLLEDKDLYNNYINKCLADFTPLYCSMFKNCRINGISFKEKIKNIARLFLGRETVTSTDVHPLNLFQCESHRWMMMRILSEKIRDKS